jgi:threonine synthase
MKYYSTNNRAYEVDFKTAVLEGLPRDNGLFMPEYFDSFDQNFIGNLSNLTFQEISFEIAKRFISRDDIDYISLMGIIERAINFPAPVKKITENISVLELFHGPSLAFKDFGARFMAQIMFHFNTSSKPLNILVATSGDTGGAVASGFYNVEGINVIILYPSGKVSKIQEDQLTKLGGNIHAFEVQGDFDDCQAMVKKAFLDNDLKEKLRLSSANSINIARLIPQSFYYFESFKQIENKENAIYSIPSGNFGNLTAGLFAKKLGLPISAFLAATNQNDVIPRYLESGNYIEKNTIATISNAMDVSSPSNFKRMDNYFGSTWNNFKELIRGYSYTDSETVDIIKKVYNTYGYILDPHGAIGFAACEDDMKTNNNSNYIFLETAHPIKFENIVQESIGQNIEISNELEFTLDKKASLIPNDYLSLKEILLANFK